MSLPMEARFAPGEETKVNEAIEALRKDSHAPREISVKVLLHIHREYPKHIITTVINKEGEEVAVTNVVNSPEEEAALASAPAEAGKETVQ